MGLLLGCNDAFGVKFTKSKAPGMALETSTKSSLDRRASRFRVAGLRVFQIVLLNPPTFSPNEVARTRAAMAAKDPESGKPRTPVHVAVRANGVGQLAFFGGSPQLASSVRPYLEFARDVGAKWFLLPASTRIGPTDLDRVAAAVQATQRLASEVGFQGDIVMLSSTGPGRFGTVDELVELRNRAPGLKVAVDATQLLLEATGRKPVDVSTKEGEKWIWRPQQADLGLFAAAMERVAGDDPYVYVLVDGGSGREGLRLSFGSGWFPLEQFAEWAAAQTRDLILVADSTVYDYDAYALNTALTAAFKAAGKPVPEEVSRSRANVQEYRDERKAHAAVKARKAKSKEKVNFVRSTPATDTAAGKEGAPADGKKKRPARDKKPAASASKPSRPTRSQ